MPQPDTTSARASVSQWPRVTLWRCFAVLTFAVLILSHTQTAYQVQFARKRLENLHAKFGVARILDRDQPAAQGLWLSERDTVRVHVYQPSGKRYRLCCSLHNINEIERPFPVAEYQFETPNVIEFWLSVKSSPGSGAKFRFRCNGKEVH